LADFPDVFLNIKANIATAKQGLQEVKNSVKNLGDGLKSLTGTSKIAAGVFLGQLARDAMGALTRATGEASRNFMDYEETITKIVSATSVMGEEAERLAAELGSVSEAQTDLGFTAGDAASALEALVKAGMSSSDSAEALRSALSLARLEGISTEKAANLLVQTLTMFGLEANDSAAALDSLSKAADAGIDTAEGYASGIANCGAAASNMGLSLEESLAALVALDKTYGSATESGTYLNAMFKDLIAKSDQLDISLYNADGSMKSLDSIVEQIRGKVQGFGSDQKAANEYLSIFDVRAQRAVLGLINYDGSIKETMTDMEEARSVQDKMNMVMDTTAGRLAATEAKLENASLAMGAMAAEVNLGWKEFALMLGPVGAVADALGPSLLQGALAGIGMMLPQIVTKIAATGVATSLLTIKTGLLSAATSIMAAAQWLLNIAMSANPLGIIIIAIAALVAGLIIAYKTITPFREAVDALGNNIMSILKPAIDALKPVFAWLTEDFTRLLMIFCPFILQIKIMQAAFEALKGPIDAVAGLLGGLVGVIGGAMSGSSEAVEEGVGSIASSVEYLEDALPEPIGNAMGAIKDLVLNMTGTTEEYYMAWAADQIDLVEETMAKEIAAVDAALAEELAIIDAALAEKMAVLEAARDEQLALAEAAYQQEYAAAVEHWLADLVEPVIEGFEKVYQEYEEHYADVLDDTIRSYDSLLSESEAHYSEEYSAVNSFYDNMLAEQKAYLTDIREGRQEDLNDLELAFLLEKQALEQSLEDGRITQEDFNAEMETLEKDYRDTRGEISEDYRIQELQAEKDFKESEETIEGDRAAAIKKINEEEKAEIERIQGEKRDEVERINLEKKNKLEEIEANEKAIIEQYAEEKARITTEYEEAALVATTEYEEASLAATEKAEEDKKDLVEWGEGEKQRITEESQAKMLSSSDSFFGSLGSSISGGLGGIADMFSSTWSGISSAFSSFASGLSSAVGGVVDSIGGAISGLASALVGGSIWTDMLRDMESQAGEYLGETLREFEEFSPRVQTEIEYIGEPLAELAEGSRRKIGRSGVFEPVVGAPAAVAMATLAPRPSISLVINAPLVNIEGSADERTAELAAEKVEDALRNVIVEASSSGAPAIHRRIRIAEMI